MAVDANDGNPPHPYVPRELVIPHYVPNDMDVWQMLPIFFGVIAVTLGVFWLYMKTVRHLRNNTTTKLKLLWFLSCGLIHSILEGYFALHHKTIAGEQTFLAQLWKEYGMGDSRYVTSDTFTVCMESITAFIDGPLALWAVYAFLRNKPYRYVVQILLSLCQLYGDVLYFSTEIYDGCSHGYMWHPLYFWFYFFFMNILWIVIPFVCIVEAYNSLSRAQAVSDSRMDKRK